MADQIAVALARALALDPRIWATPERLRAVLMDLCPGKQAHRRVLVAAAEEGIVAALVSRSFAPASPEIRLLSSRLQTRAGIDSVFADWAVKQWSAALGLTSGLDLREPPAFEARPPQAAAPAPPPAVAALRSPTAPPSAKAPVGLPLPSRAPVSPPPSRRTFVPHRLAAVMIVLALAIGGGLYILQDRQSPPAPEPPRPEVSERRPLPADWWNDPSNLRKLETLFIGTATQLEGKRQAVVLEIRGVRAQEGRGLFEYTLNTQSLRLDNLGTIRRGKLHIPDLGTGALFLEAGRLTLLGNGPSPSPTWELRAAAP